jgi:hypothetical protein
LWVVPVILLEGADEVVYGSQALIEVLEFLRE